MDDRGRIGLAIGFGAIIGGTIGYLLFTDHGRDLRSRVEPRVQDLLKEIDELSRTFDRARAAAIEGWQSFNRLMQEDSRGGRGTMKAGVVGDPVTGIPSGRTH